MHAIRKITDDLLYVGVSDRRLALFENAYPVPDGASFNAYVLLDDETVLFDAVDKAVREPFLEQLDQALNGRALSYVFVHHVEPDHSAALGDVLARHPSARLVLTAQAARMMAQFYQMDALQDALIVKEGDQLSTGRHHFRFVTAPMVHWPEVMFSFDETDGVLFSADAFGAYGALGGEIFADEPGGHAWLDEARRYYTNIVGKYGAQVTAVLKKAAALDIKMICPLHGPIWRDDLSAIRELYSRLSAYEPEETSVMIAYASVYGHTERAATMLAMRLAERGVVTRVFDTSKTDSSYLIAEAFRASHLVVASPTYNMGIFPCMQVFIEAVTARGLKNRTVAIIENGSWSPNSGKLMAEALGAGNRVLDERVTIKSALNDESRAALDRLADALIGSMPEVG